MTYNDDLPERTTFRALFSDSDLSTFDTFRLDPYGNGIKGIGSGFSISYGKVDPCNNAEDADAVGHRSLVGGDYSGGALVRSNLKAFRALVEEETQDGDELLPIVDYTGGYGTDGVLLLLDREHDAEKLRPFVDLLRGLEDYPVVCEETMSEVEHDDENEAWTDYAEGDFAKELAEHIGQDTEVEDRDPAVYPDSVTLRDLFTTTADSANLNGGPGVIHEESEGAYFMTSEAAEAVSPVLLFALGMVKLDADTMLDLAASTDSDDGDDARRILRLSRLGLGLRQLSKGFAAALYARTITQKMEGLDKGSNLSSDAIKVIHGEADRQARDLLLSAEIDAGDTSAPIGAEGLNRPQRIATVKLDRFKWSGKAGVPGTMLEASFELDPASPYVVDHEAIRAFVAQF